MLYAIEYEGNKKNREKAWNRLEKCGAAILNLGIVEVYFLDKNVAQQVADELTEFHLQEGIEYNVISLDNIYENEVEKEKIIHSSKEYDEYFERKNQRVLHIKELGI